MLQTCRFTNADGTDVFAHFKSCGHRYIPWDAMPEQGGSEHWPQQLQYVTVACLSESWCSDRFFGLKKGDVSSGWNNRPAVFRFLGVVDGFLNVPTGEYGDVPSPSH